MMAVRGIELIRGRKEALVDKVKEIDPEFVQEYGDAWMDNFLYRGFIAESGEDMADVLELAFWQNLEKNLYWRALDRLKELSLEERQERFTPEDYRSITDVMVDQAMRGEAVANSFPIYYAVWKLFKEEGSPIAEYITEEQIRSAVNDGFWESLGATANEQTERGAQLVFGEVLSFEHFWSYFNFVGGVERAVSLPDNLSFGSEENVPLSPYFRWYLVQDGELFRQLGEDYTNVSAKLATPLVTRVLSYSGYSGEFDWLSGILNHYVGKDKIRSPVMQKALRELFESKLESGLRCIDRSLGLDQESVAGLPRLVGDLQASIEAVWERLEMDTDISNLPKLVPPEYTPIKYRKEYLQSLRERLESTDKFDAGTFEDWMTFPTEGIISRSMHGRVKNVALKVYYEQKRRPIKQDLLVLERLMPSPERSSDWVHKTNAYLFADLLNKGVWKEANEISMAYAALPRSPQDKFESGIKEYVENHGLIKIGEKGLDSRVCYPSYNRIPDLVKRFEGKYFVTK